MVRRVVVSRSGDRDALRLRTGSLPSLRPGEARVRVLAAGLSFADVLERQGAIPGHTKPPFTSGHDMVGLVDATDGKGELRDGQMVVALLNEGGGHAEFVCVPQADLVPVPDGVSPVDAAAVALNFFVAHQMLHRVAAVPHSGSIMVHGAAGGVGTAFLQLARLSAITCYGTTSGAKTQVVRALGGIPIDHRTSDFVRAAAPGVDAAFDPIGGMHFVRSARVVRRDGTLVGFGAAAAARRRGGKQLFAAASLGLLGVLGLIPVAPSTNFYTASSLRRGHPESYRDDLATVMGLLAEKKISPLVAQQLPLSEIARAHEALERGEITGKIVMVTDETWGS